MSGTLSSRSSVVGVGGPTVAAWWMSSATAMHDAAHVSVRPDPAASGCITRRTSPSDRSLKGEEAMWATLLQCCARAATAWTGDARRSTLPLQRVVEKQALRAS
eukprot:261103-Chlamydomonas_euryale.AAC.1